MDEAKLREDLLSVTRKIAQRGWAPGSSGNTSIRIPETNSFLIKVHAHPPYATSWAIARVYSDAFSTYKNVYDRLRPEFEKVYA